MAEEAGVSAEQIAALPRWESASCFVAQEQAALRLADEVTRGPGASEAAVAQLKQSGFDDAQVVELVLTASFYVCVGRFLTSMDVGLEPGHETTLPTL